MKDAYSLTTVHSTVPGRPIIKMHNIKCSWNSILVGVFAKFQKKNDPLWTSMFRYALEPQGGLGSKNH